MVPKLCLALGALLVRSKNEAFSNNWASFFSKPWGRFRKRNLKHAKECSIQQRRGFACGVCRWKRRFGCSRNSAVSAARFESGFRERDGQGQHWRGPHSHGGFLKMIVCESGGHANGLTYFIFRFLRRPLYG